MESDSFISGVWCGIILGAALMLLLISLIAEAGKRKRERRLGADSRKLVTDQIFPGSGLPRPAFQPRVAVWGQGPSPSHE